MKPVRRIIQSVLSALCRQRHAYTTLVYPSRERAVVVHDGLGIAAERPWYECAAVVQAPPALSTLDMQSDLLATDPSDVDPVVMTVCGDSWMDNGLVVINPATGLPMVGGVVDVMGNPMGIDMGNFDAISNDFSCSDMDSFDSCGPSSNTTF